MKTETVIADTERGRICFDATLEITSITILIDLAIDHLDHEDLVAIKALMKRLVYLNLLIMSAVSDDTESNEKLRKRFN